MSFLNLLILAFRALNKNKLRSLLTMLGIIIGVASVIAMLAIGQGSKESISAEIQGLGTNVLILFPSATNTGGVRGEAGSAQKITLEDTRAIKERCESVKYISPIVRAGAQLVVNGQNWRSSVFGVVQDYFPIRNLVVVKGIQFSPSDERAAAKVCIVGQTVVNNLFAPDEEPIGKLIRINNIPFKIVGVLGKKGQNMFGQDQDDIVLAPFFTVQRRMLSTPWVQQALISAIAEDKIMKAQDEISDVLRERHMIKEDDPDDFTIRNQAELSSAATATSAILTVLLASIASISLIVGGIGIMNIMLVSVTERTREIGIRMAVGARSRDVLRQFLIEAVVLSLVGGLIGVLIGVGIGQLVGQVLGWPVRLQWESIVMAFGFSSAIGVFFGWYPARIAARMNPIEALRFE
jgi:putative ABC transport system permease protein